MKYLHAAASVCVIVVVLLAGYHFLLSSPNYLEEARLTTKLLGKKNEYNFEKKIADIDTTIAATRKLYPPVDKLRFHLAYLSVLRQCRNDYVQITKTQHLDEYDRLKKDCDDRFDDIASQFFALQDRH